jgi:2-polyprenyl-6-methoxyphenol hydroxylase-like FAD-dependent oxidoreductase
VERRVEVAGAGIAGLSVAIMLARHGWRVRVHERADQVREIGAGIFLKENSLTVLDKLGVLPALRPRGIRLERAEVRDHAGRLLQRRSLAAGNTVINFPRQALIETLHAAAVEAGAEVRTGSEVAAAEPAGTLVLSSGERLTADLVIGADGQGSAVRESLRLTGRHRALSTMSTRYLLPSRLPSPENITCESWSGRRRIGIAACTDEDTYVYLACPVTDRAGCEQPLNVAAWTSSFPALRPVFALLHESQPTQFPYPFVRCRSWAAGAVALIGDAAHALPPTLGQGSGLAIANAMALVEHLERHAAVPDALREWEARQRPVTDITQRWSRRYDALTAFWPRRLRALRSGIIWAFGRSHYLNRRMRIADRP